jgi:hypothetical protein
MGISPSAAPSVAVQDLLAVHNAAGECLNKAARLAYLLNAGAPTDQLREKLKEFRAALAAVRQQLPKHGPIDLCFSATRPRMEAIRLGDYASYNAHQLGILVGRQLWFDIWFNSNTPLPASLDFASVDPEQWRETEWDCIRAAFAAADPFDQTVPLEEIHLAMDLEYNAAVLATQQAAPNCEPAADADSAGADRGAFVGHALAIILEHQEWPVKDYVAQLKRSGFKCSRSTLYRYPTIVAALEARKGNKGKLPRGFRTTGGGVEAIQEED